MKISLAIVSFLFVFTGVFFLSGWFLMPHLPPTPSRPVSFLEGDYWIDNWIGIVLGLALAIPSARSSMAKEPDSAKDAADQNG